jgi:AraC-like DNA-binding protein
MAFVSDTVAVSNARRVLDYAIQRGAPEELAELPPCSRIPSRRMFEIWATLVRTLDAPDLPIAITRTFHLEQLDLLGFVVLTAPTLEASLTSFAEYAALLNDGRSWKVTNSARRVAVRLVDPSPRDLGVRLSHETAIAQLVHAVRLLTAFDIDPLLVSFAHPAPCDVRAHRALFRCPLEFDAPVDEVVFSRAPFADPPKQANRELWRYLRTQADRAVAELPPRPLLDRARHAIMSSLAAGERAEMPGVAASLGVTERTLRRALSHAGTSFREMTDDVRRDRTRELLATRAASITTLAFEAGFADASAFTHACRRWFGRPPSELAAAGRRR